jgi:hypothetical protein
MCDEDFAFGLLYRILSIWTYLRSEASAVPQIQSCGWFNFKRMRYPLAELLSSTCKQIEMEVAIQFHGSENEKDLRMRKKVKQISFVRMKPAL